MQSALPQVNLHSCAYFFMLSRLFQAHAPLVSCSVSAVRIAFFQVRILTDSPIAARSLPMAVGTCGIMGGVMGLYKYTNGMKMHDSKPTAEKSFFKPTAVVEAIKRQ
jgi:hypothetical protein